MVAAVVVGKTVVDAVLGGVHLLSGSAHRARWTS